jgi:cyanate lyase
MSTVEKKNPAAVLATALIQLKKNLHLSTQDLADIIGQHRNDLHH